MTENQKLRELERLRVRAAEEAVIESIPKDLLEHFRKANEEFAAKGGCPGCGSKRIAIHNLPCSVAADDLY